jgi:F420-non-reducing hydrogenase iron-sulfur subunit
MCSGRVDLAFVLRAFSNGMDGVFIGGCHLNECHYITNGNHHAYSMVQLCQKLMRHVGLNPERLRIEQMSAGEGIRYAEVINDFSRTLLELGPIGAGEGIDPSVLKAGLEGVTRLIPYIRLVERERLRVRFNSAEEYAEYFNSDEVDRLFKELIFDKLAVGQILALLRERPRTVGDISESLGMDSSEVSRYLNVSARQGYSRFDESQKRFVASP